MIKIEIPNRGMFEIEYLVLDVNGTIAVDGKLIHSVAESLKRLQSRLTIRMITADTHGGQAKIDSVLGFTAERLNAGNEAEQKESFVRSLGAEKVIAMGNGANDALMLRAAAIGIAVMAEEGVAAEALSAADLVIGNPIRALEVIENPKRLIATLRK
jgi:P-type E1-E2 ATPase